MRIMLIVYGVVGLFITAGWLLVPWIENLVILWQRYVIPAYQSYVQWVHGLV